MACTGFWWGNLRERDQWGDPGIDVRIILRWIFSNWDVGVWTGSSWLKIGTGGVYWVLVGKPEGKGPVGRPRNR